MSSETRKVILLIDNAGDFISLFKRVLEREKLTKEFICQEVIPSGANLLEDCLRKISNILDRVGEIAVVLVDIVLDESIKPTEKQIKVIDRSGFKLAAELRKKLPDTPILGITQWARVQMLLTDVTLDENFDGLLLKGVLTSEGFSKNKFLEYIDKARSKRANQRAARLTDENLMQSRFDESATLTKHLSQLQISKDPITSFQVEDIGEGVLDKILYEAFGNAEGLLKYFSPGFSGAKLFEINGRIHLEGMSQPNVTSWILKLSSDISGLRKEIEKHKNLKNRGIPKEFYPSLLREELIIESRWAAIVTQKDPEAITLRSYVKGGAADVANLIEGGISSALSELYGTPHPTSQLIWQRFYSMTRREIAAIRAALDGLGTILIHQGDLTESVLERVDQFVVTKGLSQRALHEYRQDVDTRNIHGDFHTRNILVNPTSKAIATIDFPNSAQDHAAKDFAKLETDLVFSVIDSDRGTHTNWSSVPGWLPFLESTRSTDDFFGGQRTLDSSGMSIIGTVRASAKALLPDLSKEEYLLSVLFYSLKLIPYPDISLPKKALAVKLINRILDELSAFK